MTRRLIAVVFAGTVLGSMSPAAAYPIAPHTLWALTEKAELVVLATVKEVQHAKPGKDPDWDGDIAVLEVKEVWKGRAGRDVRVSFTAGMACPAPARFQPLLDVVAFLGRDQGAARYSVVGLSYGTLYPEHREVPMFRNLIKNALTVQALKDGPAAGEAHTEWLVQAAEEPATRWHGLYELDSSGDGMHAFYDEKERKAAARLTEAQWRRLMRAFVDRPRLDGTMPMMLKLLGNRPSAEVDQVAVAGVDTALEARQPPYWVGQLITVTRQRLGQPVRPAPRKPKSAGKLGLDLTDDPLLAALLGEADAEKQRDAVRAQWAALRKNLRFPDRRLQWPVQAAVRGVGADSPP